MKNMAAGKSNKEPWSSQMDNLPLQEGSSFDKEAMWERLHQRMQGKEEKKKLITWFWWVGASVAASFVLFFLLPGKHTKQEFKPTIATKQKQTNQVPGVKEEKIVSEEKINTAVLDKKNIQPVPLVRKDKKKEEEPENSMEELLSEYKEVSVVTPVPIDTITTAVVVSPKKKLKVIHNNELGGLTIQPVEKNNVAANNNSFFPGFHKPVNNIEDYSDDTMSKKKPRRPILSFSSLVSQKD
jgi:hypothetical protein